jgi:hypothetical protein
MKIRFFQSFRCFPFFLFLLQLGASLSGFSQTFESSNLPILIIDTEGRIIKDDPKIIANLSIIDNGNNQVNRLTDSPNDYVGKIGIELRGASSQELYPKKSYGFETRTEDDQNLDVSLLGMPKDNDWVLYAPYGDKSLIRNVLTYHIGRQMGRYASRTRFCELVLDGQYQGVYVLMEKIKRGKDRVDISKLDPEELTGDDITGGYIIKIDKGAGNDNESGWKSQYTSSSNKEITFRYEYPKSDEIVIEQKGYIIDFMKAFEAAMRSDQFADPVNGYAKYIDVPSFVDYMIVTEVCKNVDGYRLSFFMHKDKDSKGGKLHAGPIWDYNLAYGNANYCEGGSIIGLASDFNRICPEDGFALPFWWEKLRTDRVYMELLAERWQTLRQSLLKTDALMTQIDTYTQQLSEAQARNFTRWPILGTYVWPNFYIGQSYADEVDFLKTWLTNRLDWLDGEFSKTVTSVEEPASELGFQAAPNPFNGEVRLSYKLNQRGNVEVKIHNIQGRLVTSLTDKGKLAQKRELIWNGRDASGKEVSAGMYICTLEKEGKVLAKYKVQKVR